MASSTESTSVGADDSSPSDLFVLLDKLESKARGSTGDAGTGKWTLANDAQLATFLREFTRHVERRTTEAACTVKALEDRINVVRCDASSTINESLLRADAQFVENRVEDDSPADLGDSIRSIDAESTLEDGGKAIEDEEENDEAVIAKLEEEEDMAIKDGMQALSIYYDPADSGAGENDPYFDDDAFSENDVFNQRPLPYIVGSREFMESRHAGLGPEEEEDYEQSEGKDEEQNSKLESDVPRATDD